MTKKEFELESAMRAMCALIPTNGSTEWVCGTARNTARELARLMYSDEKTWLERYDEDTPMRDIVSPESGKYCNYASCIVHHGRRICTALEGLGITTWGQLWEHYELYRYNKIQRQPGFGKRCLMELKSIMEIA